MIRQTQLVSILAGVALILFVWYAPPEPDTSDGASDARPFAKRALGKGSGSFIPNNGQWSHSARYLLELDRMTVFLEDGAWTIALVGPKKADRAAVRLRARARITFTILVDDTRSVCQHLAVRDAAVIARVRRKFKALRPGMTEKMRRQWAAAEARELGWGGVTAVAEATGLSRPTITRGLRELDQPAKQRAEDAARVRLPGGGRHKLTKNDPELVTALEALVEPVRGDPESPLRWTCKSTTKLAEELTRRKHTVSPRTVARLLIEAGYSLQANRKTIEGATHPDRNAQFEYISSSVARFLRRRQPAISVDTKKKELVGRFRNAGREWRPKGEPEAVRVHDFLERDLGKAIPYGVYDLVNNQGWVSVGIDHDTAQFATNSIHRWWTEMGHVRFPRASHLLITADGGGSNGHRTRLWKVSLQHLADDLGMKLSVCHFPPGTSKWNKIEHRMFSFITQNWRGRPLVSHRAIVSLIASTKTRTGLVVKAALDTRHYDTDIKVTDEELARLKLTRHDFHGDWNYTLTPRR